MAKSAITLSNVNMDANKVSEKPVAKPAKAKASKPATVTTKGIDEKLIPTGKDTAGTKYDFVELKTFKRDAMKALSDKEADANIKRLASLGNQARSLAHVTACGIMLHYQEHGDYTKLYPLAAAIKATMSNSMYARFIEWCVRFSSLTWIDPVPAAKAADGKAQPGYFLHKKGTKASFNLDDRMEGGKEVKGALNQPFYKFDREDDATVRTFDLHAYLGKVAETIHREVRRQQDAEKAQDKKTLEAIKLDMDEVTKLDEIFKSFGVAVPIEKPATATATPATTH